MRSGNPALSESTFLDLASGSVVTSPDQAMTLNGTVNKTGFLLLLTVLTAAFAWNQTIDYGQVMAGPSMPWAAPSAARAALITVFKKEWSPVTAPMYALVEGLFGAISAVFNAKFPGIVFQAVLLDLRHPVRAAVRVPQRPDQGHRELRWA